VSAIASSPRRADALGLPPGELVAAESRDHCHALRRRRLCFQDYSGFRFTITDRAGAESSVEVGSALVRGKLSPGAEQTVSLPWVFCDRPRSVRRLHDCWPLLRASHAARLRAERSVKADAGRLAEGRRRLARGREASRTPGRCPRRRPGPGKSVDSRGARNRMGSFGRAAATDPPQESPERVAVKETQREPGGSADPGEAPPSGSRR